MRGFFGIGVQTSTKPGNLGNLVRSAHAFGASFVFTIDTDFQHTYSDTSRAADSVPLFQYEDVEHLVLPSGCKLVGIELTDDAIELPSFCHPRSAAYVLGPERSSLCQPVVDRCDFVVRIPTRFCINVATAGAIVMYDRVVQLGRFPARPLHPGGSITPLPPHFHGPPRFRR